MRLWLSGTGIVSSSATESQRRSAIASRRRTGSRNKSEIASADIGKRCRRTPPVASFRFLANAPDKRSLLHVPRFPQFAGQLFTGSAQERHCIRDGLLKLANFLALSRWLSGALNRLCLRPTVRAGHPQARAPPETFSASFTAGSDSSQWAPAAPSSARRTDSTGLPRHLPIKWLSPPLPTHRGARVQLLISSGGRCRRCL